MANTAPQAAPTKADEFDRKAVTRSFARLRHEVGGLVDDSYRTSPFYAPTKEAAVAKREAALKALDGLAERIDALKKENS